jgi:hypothetical protein
MKKYASIIENCRKIFRIIGVILGVWGILILVISFSSLRNHYEYSIKFNNNANTQIKFFYQTFILFIYSSFLPLVISFFLLLITKENKN